MHHSLYLPISSYGSSDTHFFIDNSIFELSLGVAYAISGIAVTAPLSDAVEPKISPRSCRVYSNFTPRNKMLPTTSRDSQFFRCVYAVVTRWRYFFLYVDAAQTFPNCHTVPTGKTCRHEATVFVQI